MKKIFYNKYIVILSGFYAIWLLGIPYIFAKTVPSVCKNISYNSNFELQVDNPQLRLNILPTAKFKANKIKFKQKNTNNFTEIESIVKQGDPVYLTKNGYGTMVVMDLQQYAALTDDIELKLDEADKAAEADDERYTVEEVFDRARERVNGR